MGTGDRLLDYGPTSTMVRGSMEHKWKMIAGLLIGSCLASAAEPNVPTKWRKFVYRSSIVALSAANLIDIGSSWGGRESTPFLRSSDGKFGTRGTAIKLGMLTGLLSAEVWLVRTHPNADIAASAANFAMAGVMSKIAANNIGIKNQYGPPVLEK
jgi:hypothetical protein